MSSIRTPADQLLKALALGSDIERAFSPVQIAPLSLRSATRLIGACLLLATVSVLVARTELVNDPNPWLIWAREISHGGIQVFGGQSSSWKPLPTLVLVPPAAISAPLAATLWVILSRAGALLATALTARVGAAMGGWFGGAIAAAVPFLFFYWDLGIIGGAVEPTAVALVLLAVEAHRSGSWRTASWLGVAVLCIRPELAPILIAYAIYLLRVRGRLAARTLIAQSVALLVAWPVAMAVLFGDPIQVMSRNRQWPHQSAGVFQTLFSGVGSPLLLLGVLGLGIIGLTTAIRRRNQLVVIASGVGLSYLGLLVLTGAAGATQVPRYLMTPLVMLAGAVGAGAGVVVRSVKPEPLQAAAAVACAAAVAWPAVERAGSIRAKFEEGMALHAAASEATLVFKAAGGESTLGPCLPLTASRNLLRPWPYSILARVLEVKPSEAMWKTPRPTYAIISSDPAAGERPPASQSELHTRVMERAGGSQLVFLGDGMASPSSCKQRWSASREHP